MSIFGAPGVITDGAGPELVWSRWNGPIIRVKQGTVLKIADGQVARIDGVRKYNSKSEFPFIVTINGRKSALKAETVYHALRS